MLPHPGRNQREFNHGVTAQAQGDTEAVLLAAYSQVMGKEQKEQYHADLNNADAALRGENGQHPGRHLVRVTGNRNHSRHEQHYQTRPLEQNRAQIPQRVEGLENIEKDLMNDLEAETYVYCVADPVQVEVSRIVIPEVSGKDHGEGQNLCDHVGEDAPELAMEVAPKHGYRDPRFQKGMSNPENVVQNLDLLAHWGVIATGATYQPVEAAGAALLSR